MSVLFSPAIFSCAVSFKSEARCLPAEKPTVKQFVPEWLEPGVQEVVGACLGDAGETGRNLAVFSAKVVQAAGWQGLLMSFVHVQDWFLLLVKILLVSKSESSFLCFLSSGIIGAPLCLPLRIF